MNIKNCLAFLSFILMFGLPAIAQKGPPYEVNLKFTVDGGNLDGAKIEITKNGAPWRTLKNPSSKENIKLEHQNTYILAFSKEGYVTKRVAINTTVPKDMLADGFPAYLMEVEIFKQYEGVNTIVYNQPVGMIRYNPTIDDFDYDTDYTKSIQSQLDQVVEEYADKTEEEKAKAKTDDEKPADKNKKADEIKAQAAKAKADEEAANAQKAKALTEEEAQAAKAKTEEENAKKERDRIAMERRLSGATFGFDVRKKLDPNDGADPRNGLKPTDGNDSRRGLSSTWDEEDRKRKEAAMSDEDRRRAQMNNEDRERRIQSYALQGNGQDARQMKEIAKTDAPDGKVMQQFQVGTKRTTRYTITRGGEVYIYDKVQYSWGGVYFFKNELPITEPLYDLETR